MKLLIATTLFSSMAMANDHSQCSLQFKDDLVLSGQGASLQRADQTLWQIDANGRLQIRGNTIDTDAATAADLRNYQQGLHAQARETVGLVADALTLATDAIEQVMVQFEVDSSEVRPGVDDAIASLRSNIDGLVISNGNEIRINGSKIHQPDGQLDSEFEKMLENSVAKLTGAVMMSVGKAMMSGDGNFEQRMNAFGEKMDTFGKQLESQMESRGEALEARGKHLCSNLKTLDQLEQRIQQQVPQMAEFDLIEVRAADKDHSSNANSAD